MVSLNLTRGVIQTLALLKCYFWVYTIMFHVKQRLVINSEDMRWLMNLEIYCLRPCLDPKSF